jgi:tRNA threonylcarbamoyladenosine biosynthesis protein TsaB
MNILAFDTCFDACSACVARTQGSAVAELASVSERFETGHAERLVPMIDDVMARSGVSFGDLDRIAVTTGPGTFTGTRIGVAAARGLALATGISLVGASSLAVMAIVARDALDAGHAAPAPATDFDLLIAVDARRGEVYAQLFDSTGRQAKSPPRVLAVEDAAHLVGASVLVAGSGAEAVAASARRNGNNATACLPNLLPEATALARIAAGLAVIDAPLQPLYLRAPDAKPQADKAVARAHP